MWGNPLSVFHMWAVQFQAFVFPWVETNLKCYLNWCHSFPWGFGGPLLLPLHTRHPPALLLCSGISQGAWYMVTFHNSVALQMLILHFELPFLSSPLSSFFQAQADSATPLPHCPCLLLTLLEENPFSGVIVLCSFVCLSH